MSRVRPFTLRGARLWPYDGGAPINPPEPGGGGGTPGGGGTGVGMLTGAAVDPPNLTSYQAADAEMGPWTVRRSYNPAGFPTSWAASAAGVDVGRWGSVWSCKPDPAQMASGALDASARAFLQSIPETHTAWVTIWHEPDVKIKQGHVPYTASQYIAAWRRFFGLVREVQADRPHLYGCLIFGSYSYISPRAGATLEELWPGTAPDGRPYVDLIAYDGYAFTGAETGSAMWGGGRAFAQSKGVRWGIAEAGLASSVSSGASGAAWMTAQAAYAAANGAGGHNSAMFLCWFDSEVGGVLPTPSTYPETRAASASIAQQYYTPYTTM